MATDLETLVVTLEANVKQYLAATKKVEASNNAMLRSIQRSIEQGSRRNEAAMARMGGNMARAFHSGFARTMRAGIAALGFGSVVEIIGKAVKSVADLRDVSQDLGISARNLQVWQRMAQAAGQDADTMARALSEVAEQSQSADSALSKLFSANRAQVTGDVQQDMLTLVKILHSAKTEAEALAALRYVFGGKLGRRMTETLLRGDFTAEFEDSRRKGELLTDEQLENAAKLEEAWNRAMTRIGTMISQAFLDGTGSWDNFEDVVVEGARQIINATAEIVGGIKQIIQSISDAIAKWNEFANKWGLPTLNMPSLGGGELIPRTGAVGGNVSVTTSQANAQAQVGALLSGRYGRTTAAAIIGNLMQESNLNPAAVGDRGASRGIAQWNMMAGRGRGLPSDLAGQTQFLMRELERDYPGVLRAMQGKSIAEQTRIFSQGFEKPGDPQMANRVRQALAAYSRLGGVSPAAGEGFVGGPGLTIPGEGGGPSEVDKIIQDLTEAYIDRDKAVKEFVQTQHDEREMQLALAQGDKERIATLEAMAKARDLNVAIGSDQYNQILAATKANQDFTTSLDQQKAAMEGMQQIGGAIGGAFDSFVQALMNGEDASTALTNALKQLASQLVSMAINSLFSNLFGGGAGGGGLFGGLFGGGIGGAMGGAPAMVGMNRGALSAGGKGGAITVGGATINVAGNADTRTVAMMSKMLEVNNQQQSARLDREWGRRSARYKSLRSP